ncbi:MAG TPA: DsbA family oxidoreductase [Nannocystis sp.]
MQALRIDVWSDIACPWCHVGKRRLEAALEQFPHRDAVEVVWHSFELDPSAPRTSEAAPYAGRLARKYGTSVADAQQMIDRMTETAARDGLDFHFEKIRPGNTFDAHRLLHLAHTRGLQDALKERLFLAYLGEGEAIGEPEVLARVAVEAGLELDEVRRVLDGDAFAAAVRADEEQARSLGIRGVPFFVFDGRHAVSGAHPSDTLLAALTTAWEAAKIRAPELAEGASCGPDGCA